MRPLPNDYSKFNKTYIDYTTTSDLHKLLQDSFSDVESFLSSIPAAKASYFYAEGKWSMKILLQHCIDTERIMAYRALCIARGELQNLPSFDENHYADASNATARTWKVLIEEMLLVRKTTILLFNSFNEDLLQQSGSANGHAVTCNALGFIIVGHFMHHQRIIKERYM